MAEGASFSQDLERLEAIVRRLEAGELDLDEALQIFEEGVKRLRGARARLAAAEAKVKQVLTDRAGTLRLDDLDR
jgi:exodeoxyribonuclease VII small subunit